MIRRSAAAITLISASAARTIDIENIILLALITAKLAITSTTSTAVHIDM